jgi:hypothetical protein
LRHHAVSSDQLRPLALAYQSRQVFARLRLLPYRTMSLELTLAVLLAALVAAALANWRERRPRDFGRPSLVPYTAIQVIAVLVIILMLAHLVSLITGQPLKGRGLP